MELVLDANYKLIPHQYGNVYRSLGGQRVVAWGGVETLRIINHSFSFDYQLIHLKTKKCV